MRTPIILFVFLALALPELTAQQSQGHEMSPLNVSGSPVLTVATGVPYVSVTELSWGITDRISLGVMAAYAPPAAAFGARLHAGLYQEDNLSVFFRMPAIYYPPHPELFCGNPWVLAWPSLHAEWQLDSGVRLNVGTGILGASCVHELLGHSSADENEGGVLMQGIWNTVSAGVIVPLSERVSFHVEVSPVLKGTRPAGSDWVAQFPVIVVLALSTSL